MLSTRKPRAPWGDTKPLLPAPDPTVGGPFEKIFRQRAINACRRRLFAEEKAGTSGERLAALEDAVRGIDKLTPAGIDALIDAIAWRWVQSRAMATKPKRRAPQATPLKSEPADTTVSE